jgi:hypothetical protein
LRANRFRAGLMPMAMPMTTGRQTGSRGCCRAMSRLAGAVRPRRERCWATIRSRGRGPKAKPCRWTRRWRSRRGWRGA